MLLDRNKYSESGYIGQELIGDAGQELEQRCMAVQQSVRDQDFAYTEALSVYQVTDAEYKSFIGETTVKNIFLSFSGTTAPVRKSDFLEIYENMLLSYFPRLSQRLKFIVEELDKEAKEMN